MSMYDKLPYQRNSDMCNASTLALNSGNLVKYYRCNIPQEAKKIDNQDEKFSTIVSDHIREYEKNYLELHSHYPDLYGALEEDETPQSKEQYEDDDEYEDDDF